MIFKKIIHYYYPDFYIDESNLYGIGIKSKYDKMIISIMFRRSQNNEWIIVREYFCNESKHTIKQLKLIFEKLEKVYFDKKVGGDLQDIELVLPQQVIIYD